MPSPRSTLRQEQVDLTVERIMRATADLLVEESPATISMGAVAGRAGVSPATLYRHFPGKEALYDALTDWAWRAVDRGVDDAAMYHPRSPEELAGTIPQAVANLAEVAPVYRLLDALPGGRERRARQHAVRRRSVAGALEEITEGLDDDDADRLRALVHLLASSRAAFFMDEQWGVPPDRAGRTLAWAVRVLARAAADEKGDGREFPHGSA